MSPVSIPGFSSANAFIIFWSAKASICPVLPFVKLTLLKKYWLAKSIAPANSLTNSFFPVAGSNCLNEPKSFNVSIIALVKFSTPPKSSPKAGSAAARFFIRFNSVCRSENCLPVKCFASIYWRLMRASVYDLASPVKGPKISSNLDKPAWSGTLTFKFPAPAFLPPIP